MQPILQDSQIISRVLGCQQRKKRTDQCWLTEFMKEYCTNFRPKPRTFWLRVWVATVMLVSFKMILEANLASSS